MKKVWLCVLLYAMTLFASGTALAQTSTTTVHAPACYSGAWYDPAYSGNGITFAADGNGLMWVAWYMHDLQGNLQWFTTSAQPQEFVVIYQNPPSRDFVYKVDLAETSQPGGYALTANSPVNTEKVGTLSITIKSDANYEMSMDWEFDSGTTMCSGFSPQEPTCSGHWDLHPLILSSPCPSPSQ